MVSEILFVMSEKNRKAIRSPKKVSKYQSVMDEPQLTCDFVHVADDLRDLWEILNLIIDMTGV